MFTLQLQIFQYLLNNEKQCCKLWFSHVITSLKQVIGIFPSMKIPVIWPKNNMTTIYLLLKLAVAAVISQLL